MSEREIYRTAGLTPTFTPAWWLPGAHAQTLWGKFGRTAPAVPTRRERCNTPDGDWLDLEHVDGPPGSPRLLVLHGLEGSPDSHYVRSTFHEARRRGWRATLLIFRGCSGEMNRGRRLYHSGETTDLAFVVDRLRAADPGGRIGIVGFSLGGNVLLKWLGELAEDVPAEVAAAAAVSVPYDLARGSRHLEHGFARVYSKAFLLTLKEKAAAKVAQFPDLPVDAPTAAQATTLWEFDDAMTAPMHGFQGAADYYARSSSLGWLPSIRRPTLLLNAVDDPFLPPAVLDDARRAALHNNALVVEFPAHGGHVGFVGGESPLRPFYYAESRVAAYLAPFLTGATNATAVDPHSTLESKA
jgi:predicted alpha/beta-fold hydrolase